MTSIKELSDIIDVVLDFHGSHTVYFFIPTTREFQEKTSWLKNLGASGINRLQISKYEQRPVFCDLLQYGNFKFYYIDVEEYMRYKHVPSNSGL